MSATIGVGDAGVAGIWTTYINRKFVDGLKAKLLFADYAEPSTVPKNDGYVHRWNIPTMVDGSVTALTACSSGAAANLVTFTAVEGTVSDYGQYIQVDSLAKDTQISTALDEYKMMLEYSGASAIDTLLRNQAQLTTNYMVGGASTTNTGTTNTSAHILCTQDFPVIASFFHENNAMGWDKLNGDYAFLINPRCELNLVTDVTTGALDWVAVNQNVPVGFKQLQDTHQFVGRFAGVTAIRTTKIQTVTSGVSVTAFKNVALARWGIGIAGIAGTSPSTPRIIIKSEGGTFDPLETTMTIGWKGRLAAKLLDVKRALVHYHSETEAN